jgi:hypothetical protein
LQVTRLPCSQIADKPVAETHDRHTTEETGISLQVEIHRLGIMPLVANGEDNLGGREQLVQAQCDRVARHHIGREIQLRRVAQRFVRYRYRATCALGVDEVAAHRFDALQIIFEILDAFDRGKDSAPLAIRLAHKKNVVTGGKEIPLQARGAGIGEANVDDNGRFHERPAPVASVGHL